MVAETWILKLGNQVSNKRKTKSKKVTTKSEKQTIGILSFEVANVMSMTVLLHKSLIDSEVSKLKAEILKSEGVLRLVSNDESYLLELVFAEKLQDLNRVATVVSGLGKKCNEPALQGFEHVYSDVVSGVIDVKELSFLVKDMDGMVRKMERYVNATSNLYSELEVLNELEQASKKFQHNQHEESRRAFEQKVVWQKQDVRHLKDVSLWNQTFDKVVELLARTVCTIYARICFVFGDSVSRRQSFGGTCTSSSPGGEVSGQIYDVHQLQMVLGPLRRALSKSSTGSQQGHSERGCMERREVGIKSHIDAQRSEVAAFRTQDVIFPCGASPGRFFMNCLSLSSSASKFDDEEGDNEEQRSQVSGCCSIGGLRREYASPSCYSSRTPNGVPFGGDQRQAKCIMDGEYFGPKSRSTVKAPPSTVGGSALALHYANVIIVIEKLLRYPHLVGEEARDDLYQMLPTSLRMSLKIKLKSYIKNLAIYDAPLAHDWKENLDGILTWLAPLAHNMIRWQSERNFEQHQIVKRTNVLLLQTLYFADRERTEAAICELLVGLNYICRYEQQQNALLDCASSFDYEDCMQWQMQCQASFLDQY